MPHQPTALLLGETGHCGDRSLQGKTLVASSFIHLVLLCLSAAVLSFLESDVRLTWCMTL
jgi:hypothetical protein